MSISDRSNMTRNVIVTFLSHSKARDCLQESSKKRRRSPAASSIRDQPFRNRGTIPIGEELQFTFPVYRGMLIHE
jgi:hypothetical protein